MARRPRVYVAILFLAVVASLIVKAERKAEVEMPLSAEDRIGEANSMKNYKHLQGDSDFVRNTSLDKPKNDKHRFPIIRPYSPPKPCSSRNSRRCCGGYLIENPSRKKCCRGRIVLKSLVPYLCHRNKPSLCGGQLYHRNRDKCCYRHVIPRRSKCRRRRCGRRRYVTHTQRCCYEQVLPRSATCSAPKNFLCGGVRFKPRTHECCSGRLILKSKPVQCCKGVVIAANLPCLRIKFICSGKLYYPEKHKCCSGRLIPKSPRSVHVIPRKQSCKATYKVERITKKKP